MAYRCRNQLLVVGSLTTAGDLGHDRTCCENPRLLDANREIFCVGALLTSVILKLEEVPSSSWGQGT